MSAHFSKECVAMLTAIVTEICDDSDDEDLLPFKVIAGIQDKLKSLKKKRKILGKDRIYKQSHYTRPSRFENKDCIEFKEFDDRNVEVCEESLKPINKCLCSRHISQDLANNSAFVVNQRGGAFITESDFKAHWHMSKSTVETVFNLVNAGQAELRITPTEFLVALWSLATDEPLEAIESRFSVPKDQIPSSERLLFDALIIKRFDLERWPQGVAAELTKKGFQDIGSLPAVLGAVGAVHFQCNGLPYAGTFINSNYEKTVIFELACDHRGTFTYSSYFWWPGKLTPAEVYEQSKISSMPLSEGSYLVASRWYAPFKNFVTPFEESSTPLIYKEFNIRHNKAMQVLRSAVFSLVTRFATLRMLKVQNAWVVRKKFAACLLLHNICSELGDFVTPDAALGEDSYFPSFPFSAERDAECSLKQRICSDLETHSASLAPFGE